MKALNLLTVSILVGSLATGLNARADEIKPQSAPPVVSEKSVQGESKVEKKELKKESKKDGSKKKRKKNKKSQQQQEESKK